MKLKIKITTRMVRRTILWTLLVGLIALFTYVVVDSYDADHKYSNATIPESVMALGEYKEYLDKFPLKNYPKNADYVALGVDGFDVDPSFELHTDDYEEAFGAGALKTLAAGSVSYEFNVAQSGFYNILIDYIPEDFGGGNIERKIIVNGKVPYDDLLNVSFQRVWGDGGQKIVDITGNEIKPVQIELPERRVEYVKDDSGYVTEPYLVWLNPGKNVITIESVRQSMSIFAVHVVSKETYKEYAEVKKEYAQNGYQPVTGGISYLVEGEDSTTRSSSTIYAISDRSNAYNSPADPVRIILNSIGGSKWSTPGDWINWDITVPQTGLYNISMRVKQSTSRGLFSTRKIYINDQIPFAEAQNAKFVYNSDFSMVTLGTDEEPFYFYFEAGKKYSLRLEATLGDYGSQINRVQSIIDDLNSMYRQIISKTGINPDKYIDYHLTEKIPNLIETFQRNANDLDDIARIINEISGEKSGETASLEATAIQLRNFVENPRNIQKNLKNFSYNISSLGTWILNVSRQELIIDYIVVHSNDYQLPNANPNFFKGTWFGIKSFFESFFFDYSSIGTTAQNKNNKTVEVWLLTSETTGREQANAIRTLVDSTFNMEYDPYLKENLNVNLKVVDPSVLLMATLAGRGPDIAINVPNGTPVNYALRGATYDISNFEGFNEVTTWFQDSAMTPYEFNGGYYALPNTQSFLMTFYRKDIFDAQGWKVPETWDDVINIIPELQIQNLKFYLPLNTIGASSVVNQIFASRLYQTGGTFYRSPLNSKGQPYMESNFDSEEAMAAFEFWCEFYTSYSFSLTPGSFINYFRRGEMPIGIAGYDTYNTLAVSAPEIRGKWAFALLPGTKQADGTIDHSGAASGTSVIMMKQTDVPNEAWEFMRWWVSKETQIGYAREVEAILGTAARHPTANIEAFKQLAWTVEEQQVLLNQWDVTVGVPEVAGGYYTGRNLENAFRKVVDGNLNPRDTFDEYILTINAEITRKREEFGLPIGDVE